MIFKLKYIDYSGIIYIHLSYTNLLFNYALLLFYNLEFVI
jgi:hypothetical protein